MIESFRSVDEATVILLKSVGKDSFLQKTVFPELSFYQLVFFILLVLVTRFGFSVGYSTDLE